MTVDLSFYAPQAQVVDGDDGNVIALGGTQELQHGNLRTTVADLVSLKVTLKASGTSQVQLTLNNQRRDRQHIDPGYPPWKYNDLQTFTFGKHIRIDLRYAAAGGHDQPWQHMIHARITDMSFSFPQSGGAMLTVTAEDFLSVLAAKPEEDKTWNDVDETTLFQETLDRASWNRPSIIVVNQFGETLHSATHNKGQSYLDFLKTYADHLDSEIFVENDVERASQVTLHFERARSRVDGNSGPTQPLEWGKSLIDFSPKLQVWDQFTAVSYKGSHPRRRLTLQDVVGAEIVNLDRKSTSSVPMLNAIEVRARYFRDATTPSIGAVEATSVDNERAREWASAVLLAKARELMTAEATTIGMTALRPGMFVDIRRMHPPFDGLYYVTQTVHSLDTGGYRTHFSLRRPWMFDPANYLEGVTRS